VVTRVSERTGQRIGEDDYDHLTNLAGWVEHLATPTPGRTGPSAPTPVTTLFHPSRHRSAKAGRGPLSRLS
jgi:hypothetical protein